MTIETYNKVYTVVRHLYAGLHMDHYVCRCRDSRQLYNIIRVKNRKITAQIIEFLSIQKSSKKFSDFVDEFVYQGDLHAVFTYTEGKNLLRKLEEPCTLEERMEIGKRLIERMVLLEQPYYFQCQCLSPENIIVTASLDVRFWYTFHDIEKYDTYGGQQAAAYLYRVIRLLFAPELRNHVLDPMEDFLKQLQEEKQPDDMVRYQRYCAVCEEIRKIPKEEMELPKNFLYHVWNFIKSVRGLIKRTMLTLIFICVFIYMICCIYRSFQVQGYVWHFQSIGTMQLEEETAFTGQEHAFTVRSVRT